MFCPHAGRRRWGAGGGGALDSAVGRCAGTLVGGAAGQVATVGRRRLRARRGAAPAWFRECVHWRSQMGENGLPVTRVYTLESPIVPKCPLDAASVHISELQRPPKKKHGHGDAGAERGRAGHALGQGPWEERLSRTLDLDTPASPDRQIHIPMALVYPKTATRRKATP